MATNTPNLGLRKPDGLDLVNVLADIGANMDIIDALGNAWTPYTPVLGGTGVALGNGSLLGRFRRVGKSLDLAWVLTFGSTSAAGSGAWTISLPAAMTARASIPQFFGSGLVSKASAGSFAVLGSLAVNAAVMTFLCASAAGNTVLNYVQSTVPGGAWVANDSIHFQGRCELQ